MHGCVQHEKVLIEILQWHLKKRITLNSEDCTVHYIMHYWSQSVNM